MPGTAPDAAPAVARRLEVTHRIDGAAVDPDLEVQVVPGAAPRAADGAERLPDALNNAGYAALLRGDYPQARILFLKAIDASPSFYEPSWSNLRFLSSVEQRQALAERAP